MSDDQAKISRASEILKEHRVGETAGKLLNEWFRFESTPSVSFNRRVQRAYVEESATGILMEHQGHELVIATTKFRKSAAPDNDDHDADGLIYFDGVLVLKVGATKSFDEYGSTISLSTYPFSIKSMKAGPWLELLTACYEALDADHWRRQTAEAAERRRKQANDIDLG